MSGFFYFCILELIDQINKNKFMGRGDKKTKKGKIFKGSFGKTRPAKVVKKKAAEKKETK